MSGQDTRLPFGAIELSAVVIRACECGTPRPSPDAPCPGCGTPDAPQVADLGVIAGNYLSPRRHLWWLLIGQHAANRRIRRANKARPS